MKHSNLIFVKLIFVICVYAPEIGIKIFPELKLSSIALSGVKEKRNGTLRNVKRARATDQLEVCFTVTENEIAKASDRSFYIEVLDPQGRVINQTQYHANPEPYPPNPETQVSHLGAGRTRRVYKLPNGTEMVIEEIRW